MATRVQIAFDLTVTTPVNFFTLDDTMRGVLDNTAYVLGGDTLVDVTSDVRAVQIKRGRSRQLDRFVAGAANITLNNRTRKYDPLNTASPYYGSLIPRKQVVIDVDGTPLYTGLVADWNFGYDPGGDSVAEPSCVDGFSLLAQQTLTAGTQTSQATGARINAKLTELGWSTATRTLSTGQATLDADVIPNNENALQYLQKIETSEPGALFVGKAGDIVFRDRAYLQAFTSGVTFGEGGIPFSAIDIVYGIEEMANSISVTYTAGATVAGTAVSDSLASQTKYGVMDQKYDTLLADAVQAQAMADWQASIYDEPVYRVNAVTISMLRLTSIQKASVLSLDLGDVVLVTWTPNNIGSAVSQYVSVDAIEHQIDPAQHLVTFTMSQAAAAFILDNATYGVLDDDILGF